MERKELLKYIGTSCKRWRQSMGLSVTQICAETCYTASSVSYFENGNSNNAVLFFWYLARGFNPRTDFRTDNPFLKMSGTELLDMVVKYEAER